MRARVRRDRDGGAHRHEDPDAVALANAELDERLGQLRHGARRLGPGECLAPPVLIEPNERLLVGTLRPAHRDGILQDVGRMQECAAAARGDEVNVELVREIARVVVPVAGDGSTDAHAALARDRGDLEEVLLFVLAGGLRQQPGRLRQADDEVVLRPHLCSQRLEVAHLAGVEVFRELDVGAPDPPVVRKLDGPVAAVLLALPPSDHVAPRRSVAR